MISKFEICKKSGCSIIIQDTSTFYIDFIEHEPDFKPTIGDFRYQDTITLNVIRKYTVDNKEGEIVKVLTVPHTEWDKCDIHRERVEGVLTIPMIAYLDESHYTFDKDGYYSIYHIILPTMDWYKSNPDFINDYDCVVVYDKGKFKVIYHGTPEIKEVDLDYVFLIGASPNLESTIAYSEKEVFITCHLEKCYVDYSKDLLDTQLNACKRNIDGQFERDFLWMTLNVIDYYIGFGQFNEAQRILEQVNYCNGFCKENQCNKCKPKKSDCGCNK